MYYTSIIFSMIFCYGYAYKRPQSSLTGQDVDLNKRKAIMHKLLSKHVNKACTARFGLVYFKSIIILLKSSSII
jgi:hypothetical protein